MASENYGLACHVYILSQLNVTDESTCSLRSLHPAALSVWIQNSTHAHSLSLIDQTSTDIRDSRFQCLSSSVFLSGEYTDFNPQYTVAAKYQSATAAHSGWDQVYLATDAESVAYKSHIFELKRRKISVRHCHNDGNRRSWALWRLITYGLCKRCGKLSRATADVGWKTD